MWTDRDGNLSCSAKNHGAVISGILSNRKRLRAEIERSDAQGSQPSTSQYAILHHFDVYLRESANPLEVTARIAPNVPTTIPS
jgi:hypothetical protein